MRGLRASDVVLNDAAAGALAGLERSTDSKASTIAKRARSLRAILLADCLHGEVVRKSAIPTSLKRKHSIENLYVEDLPDFWRLLYAIARRNGRPYVVIVEIVDHRTYSRWFPGRRD